jgi:zinc transporter ZupT
LNHSRRHLLPGLLLGVAVAFGIALVTVGAVVGRNGHTAAAAGVSNKIQVVMIAADSASLPPSTATTSPGAINTPGRASHTVSLKPGRASCSNLPRLSEDPDIR